MTFMLVVYFFLANGSVQTQKISHITNMETCQTKGRQVSEEMHDKYGKGTAAYMCFAEKT